MRKGFTLLELLIVIGILAILATTVVLVLNPAEMLRQARDSQRLSDLRTINSALGLWMVTSATTTMIATTTCTFGSVGPGNVACQLNQVTTVAGAGWVNNVNFTFIPGGSPLSRLPLDPMNNVAGVSGLYYAFSSNTTSTYELNANMESEKYMKGGPGDVESNTKDGGNNVDWYEVGTNLVLI